MKHKLLFISLLAIALCSCQKSTYKANVTELRLVSVSPTTAYAGAIVTILGRNFSEVEGENQVFVGGKEAIVLEYNKWDMKVVLPDLVPGDYSFLVKTTKQEVEGLSIHIDVKPEHTYVTSIFIGTQGKPGSVDGQGGNALVYNPDGIISNPDGGFYFLERGGSFAVRKFDNGGNATTIKTSGEVLNYPWHGDIDASGNLYFCNKGSGAGTGLKKMDKATGVISTINVAGADVTSNNPMSCAFAPDGTLYLAHRQGNTSGAVYKLQLSGTNATVLKTYDIKTPNAVMFDKQGRAIVSSTDAGYLFMINTDDSVVKIAGEGNINSKLGDGTPGDLLDKSAIGFVGGLGLAPDGSFYFCDVTALSIRKLTPDDNGDYSKGKIETVSKGFYPSDLRVTSDGTKIYVTSSTTSTIRLIEVL